MNKIVNKWTMWFWCVYVVSFALLLLLLSSLWLTFDLCERRINLQHFTLQIFGFFLNNLELWCLSVNDKVATCQSKHTHKKLIIIVKYYLDAEWTWRRKRCGEINICLLFVIFISLTLSWSITQQQQQNTFSFASEIVIFLIGKCAVLMSVQCFAKNDAI